MMLRGWGVEYANVREQHEHAVIKMYGFSSERKMASVLLCVGKGARLYNKVCGRGFVCFLGGNGCILEVYVDHRLTMEC